MATRLKLAKYIQVLKMSWQNTFVYRLNFVMWRLRTFLSLLGVYFFWHAFYQSNWQIGSYQTSDMLTYIIFTALLSAFVFSSRSQQISSDIGTGGLSCYLIQPIKYFGWMFFLDLGDKAANLFFLLFELSLFFTLVRPPFFVQTNAWLVLSFGVIAVVAVVLYFHLSALVSMITFWYPEHNGWPIRFLFETMLVFLSGGWFPLDILPQPIYQVLQLMPFGYLRYFPVKTYLGQLNTGQIVQGMIIMLVWTFGLVWLTRYLWHKGLKNYASAGI